MNRRNFLKNSALATGSMSLAFLPRPAFAIPAGFELILLATNWGFEGDAEAFCRAAKEAGYDGIEAWLPGVGPKREELFAALKKHDLKFGLLAGAWQSDFAAHVDNFKKAVQTAVDQNPLYVNCHSGRDYFTYEQNAQLIAFTTALSQQSGIPIYHETHRSRMLFAAHIARKFIETIPELRLTLDISHWVNVHESLLEDQGETVQLALERARHIHARVGHQEGPQVTDPRAPEWEKAVAAHFQWWDKVVELRSKAGERLTVLTEFGPPNYLPTVPYTGQPLANQWEINVYMMQQFRERYQK